jgi:xanthine dehydrogenase/oxidase
MNNFRFKRPVRVTLERFDDMAVSGTRHPFLFDYRLAVDEDGKFLDYEINAYNNCGMTVDLSKGVMGKLGN